MIDLHYSERGAELLPKTGCSLGEGPRQIVVFLSWLPSRSLLPSRSRKGFGALFSFPVFFLLYIIFSDR